MQQVLSKKLLGLLLAGSLLITTAPIKASLATTIKENPKSLIMAVVIATALYAYTMLHYRKTEPKRIYPKDNSFKEWFNFINMELLVGQKYLPERPSGSHVDPEDPDHTICEYSKVEARGLAGQTEYYMEKVIIPTVVLAWAYNKLLQDISKNWNQIEGWVNNPDKVFELPPVKV